MQVGNNFSTGALHGYFPYYAVKDPIEPDPASRSYGAGMATGGVGSLLAGAAPIGALYVRQARGRPISGAGGTALWLLAAVNGIIHIPGGAVTTIRGSLLATS